MSGLVYEAWLDHIGAVHRDDPPRYTHRLWRMVGQDAYRTFYQAVWATRIHRKAAPGWTPKAA